MPNKGQHLNSVQETIHPYSEVPLFRFLCAHVPDLLSARALLDAHMIIIRTVVLRMR